MDLGLALDAARKDEAAAKALSRTAELDPHNATTWRHLGLVQVRRGEVQQARDAFYQHLELDPDAEDANEVGAFCLAMDDEAA